MPLRPCANGECNGHLVPDEDLVDRCNVCGKTPDQARARFAEITRWRALEDNAAQILRDGTVGLTTCLSTWQITEVEYHKLTDALKRGQEPLNEMPPAPPGPKHPRRDHRIYIEAHLSEIAADMAVMTREDVQKKWKLGSGTITNLAKAGKLPRVGKKGRRHPGARKESTLDRQAKTKVQETKSAPEPAKAKTSVQATLDSYDKWCLYPRLPEWNESWGQAVQIEWLKSAAGLYKLHRHGASSGK